MKTIFIGSFLLLLVSSSMAQDIIFKRNGEKVTAVILEKSGSSRTYRLFNARDSVSYYISTAYVDSIIYHDGKKESFPARPTRVFPAVTSETGTYYHHLIGADVLGYTSYKHLSFSYEYLPGKAKWGIKASWTKNYNDFVDWYGVDVVSSQNARNFLQIGLNYYFFPQGTFRIGTGLHVMSGKFNYYNQGTPIDKNFQGLLFSVFLFNNINKNLAANLGFNNQLLMNPKGSGRYVFGEFLINF